MALAVIATVGGEIRRLDVDGLICDNLNAISNLSLISRARREAGRGSAHDAACLVKVRHSLPNKSCHASALKPTLLATNKQSCLMYVARGVIFIEAMTP